MSAELISYRVRLARNVKEFPFPGFMTEAQTAGLLSGASETLTKAAGGSAFTAVSFSEPNTLRAHAMMEKHLLSPEFAASSQPRCAVISADGDVSVMINEEDHLRIQVFGKNLDEAWKTAGRLDRLLEQSLGFAYDERLGYLTACPTNLGTALRVSALMHLPALTETGAIRQVIQSATQMGLTVRGLYGEGTSAQWGYYQISNRVTLGVTEEDILGRLGETAAAVVAQERGQRELLRHRNPTAFDDRLWRAYALLTNARTMGGREAMELLSVFRMGHELAGFPPNERLVDELLHEIQPAVIAERFAEAVSSSPARDVIRAGILREKLRGAHLHEQ